MTETARQRFIEGDFIYYDSPYNSGNPIVGVITKGGWKEECLVRWWSKNDGGWIFERGLPRATVVFVGAMPFWAEWDVPNE